MNALRYPIPAADTRSETEIKRSRFIATVRSVDSAEGVRSFIDSVRQEFPDARHHCWAFLLGVPGSSDRVGYSDDGEPSGTAGKPILQVLSYSGVGDVAVVVSRYFGGIKLGTGGLVKAYTQAAQQVLEEMPRTERIAWHQLSMQFDYALLETFKRELARFEAELLAEEFSDRVQWTLRLPQEQQQPFHAWATDRSAGTVLWQESEDEESR